MVVVESQPPTNHVVHTRFSMSVALGCLSHCCGMCPLLQEGSLVGATAVRCVRREPGEWVWSLIGHGWVGGAGCGCEYGGVDVSVGV